MNEQAFVQQYTTQEKLLLAQAVHKLGAVQWEAISTLLMEHPVLSERAVPEREQLFSAKACEEGYVGLMTDIGINVYVYHTQHGEMQS
jgi:bromodomain-containing protein 8